MAGFVPITVAGQKRSFTAFPTSAQRVLVDKKIPDSRERVGESSCYHPSHSPLGESQRELALGRSSGLRIILLAAPSRPIRASGCSGFRPRSQRRGRDGFSPSSLSFPLRKHPLANMSGVIVFSLTRKVKSACPSSGWGSPLSETEVAVTPCIDL